MENDPLCIKEDVCDMAVCDGVSSCSHAVLKSAVLAQQTNNKASAPCVHEWESGMFSYVCKKCGLIDDA